MKLGICELKAFSESDLLNELAFNAYKVSSGQIADWNAVTNYLVEDVSGCVNEIFSTSNGSDARIDLGENAQVLSVFLGTTPTELKDHSDGLKVSVGDSILFSGNTLCGEVDLSNTIFAVVECNLFG